MWWFLLSSCLLFLPSVVSAQILLNEVYYDHPGLDDGHEFVELINTGPVAVSLAGYSLEFHDGNTAGWKVIWRSSADDRVDANGVFVIGGRHVVPPVDTVTTLVLQNGPDAVRLVKDGAAVDRLGYGDLSDSLYFEKHPAPDVPAGFSLARWPDGSDTDDNQVDFRVSEPSPGLLNRPRHDVALEPGSGTPLRRALSATGGDVIAVRVHNRGLEPVLSTFPVELWDSTGTTVRVLDTRPTHSVLGVGDSVEVRFDVTLAAGHHHLTAIAVYGADQRPRNNRLDLLRRVGTPPVLISEVMSHPAAGCPEYVEVYNAGPESYDIGGNWIKDRANAPALIAQGSVPIAAGDFLVVTPDRTALQTWFPQLGDNHVVEVAGSWPALNHASGGQSADSVVLFDPFLLAVDRVSYPSQPGDSRGRSLERVDMYPTDGTHVWALAPPGRRGSPGTANPPAIFDRPRGPAMGLSSNPFNPGAGGMLLITVPAGAESGGAVVNLFDVRGRRVRVIGATTQLPFVFTWDGTDDNGQDVTSGFYIIACEYLTRTGRRGRVEKVVLGCARQN